MSQDHAYHHTEKLMITLIVKNAAAAIDFYKKAFAAQELFRFEDEGRIGHAELRVAGERLCISDEYPDFGLTAPADPGKAPAGLFLMVDDADYWVNRAVEQGAVVKMPLTDTFYGHRCAGLVDPFGHRWNVSSVNEIVAPDDMRRRYEEMKKAGGCGKK